MSRLHVLLIGTPHEAARLDELAAGLRRRGHSTQIATDIDNALGMETPDVLVATEALGATLFFAFQLPTGSPHGVFLINSANFQLACQAARAGAKEILLAPTIDALCEAVERTPKRFSVVPAGHFEHTYTSEQTQTAIRDLLAFTARLGLARGLRLRIVTAASELVNNVKQHAYGPTAGPLTIYMRLSNDPVGIDRLNLEVIDHGTGAQSIELDSDKPSGLDFVRALAERLDVTSNPNHGFAARVEFALAPLYFSETPAGLDELDYIDPIALRELHAVMCSGSEDIERIAPALAPTLGRLQYAGQDAAARLFASLR